MTTKELNERVRMRSLGRGNYQIEINYRGKDYKCHSNDSLTYDRLTDGWWGDNCIEDRKKISDMTFKDALQNAYNECKSKNNLI